MIQFLIVGDIGIWHFHVMWSISLICKAACFVVIWVFSARPSFLFSGIFDEDYMRPILDESFLALLQPDDLIKWKDDKGKTVNESIREHALEYIGKPIQKVIRQVSRLCACVSPRLFREFKQGCTLPPLPTTHNCWSPALNKKLSGLRVRRTLVFLPDVTIYATVSGYC